jgi:hypothetical protein
LWCDINENKEESKEDEKVIYHIDLFSITAQYLKIPGFDFDVSHDITIG